MCSNKSSPSLVDPDGGDEYWVSVFASAGKVTLAVASRDNGDTHVVLPRDVCERLAVALSQAVGHAINETDSRGD